MKHIIIRRKHTRIHNDASMYRFPFHLQVSAGDEASKMAQHSNRFICCGKHCRLMHCNGICTHIHFVQCRLLIDACCARGPVFGNSTIT